ncbi:JmjC domain-containing protein [Pseudomonas indica]|uniref:JmjC domain-containing protein n=1 Tax=Pseudomonas indica TaxID=137658 RepID=UPI003FD42301
MPFINFGINRDDFFQEHYDSHWYLQRKALKVTHFGWRDLDRALYGWEPKERQIRLFKEGAVALERYTENYVELGERRTRIVKDILYDHMKSGATLVLNKLQLRSPAIHDYCMAIAQFVGEKTNANAYAAFGGDGSFGKHWDTHDVFALQLIGRKRWKLYKPTFEHPLAHQKSTGRKSECPQEPVLDTVLEAGDLLYIPRGWWHEALPIEGEPTLHIAVGTFPIHVVDFLIWLCTSQLPEHLEGRQSLNGYLDNEHSIRSVSKRISDLLTDPTMWRKFQEAIIEQERVDSRFAIADLADSYQPEVDKYPPFSVRLNSFTPILKGQKGLMVNGVKLTLDQESCDFISSLMTTGFTDDIAREGMYSPKQQQLLRQLSERDIVELVDGHDVR